MILQSLVIGVFFLLQNFLLVIGDLPQFVYRADFRGPDEIFRDGMPSLGNNDNLLDHVDGLSCHSRLANTAFVATTREEAFARRWATDQLWITPESRSIYIYRIRASSSFYDGHQSLMHVFSQTHNTRYQTTAARYQHQQEWLAHNGIPNEQIVEVAEYQRGTDGGTLINVENRQNPNYIATESHGNQSPYPEGGDNVFAAPSRIPGLLTACFAVCRRPSSKRSIFNDPNTCPIPPIFETTLSTSTSTVWDPVSQRPVQRIVPWKEQKTLKNERSVHWPEGCSVDPGVKNIPTLLQVSCRKNEFYDQFVVFLGAGGSSHTWVDQTYKDGRTGVEWNKWSRQIPVVGTSYTLADYGYTIKAVFVSGSGWWSNIRVYPVYPLFKKANA